MMVSAFTLVSTRLSEIGENQNRLYLSEVLKSRTNGLFK